MSDPGATAQPFGRFAVIAAWFVSLFTGRFRACCSTTSAASSAGPSLVNATPSCSETDRYPPFTLGP
jgi:hypothetical protein